MRFFKGFFVFRSQIHDGAHIHFVKSGKHGRAVFCFYQSAADGSAQVGHFLGILFAAEKLFSYSSSRIGKGIQHINHQMASTDDIQRAYHHILAHKVPVVFGPGKHPTSSARFLYFEGPDGMVYEYSSGVCEIDDEAAWRSRQFEAAPRGFCKWGAKPDIREFKA